MPLSAQRFKHHKGVFLILRLSQGLILIDNYRISSDYPFIREMVAYFIRLIIGNSQYILLRRLVRSPALINIRRNNRERYAKRSQDINPSYRLACQNYRIAISNLKHIHLPYI